ncbi:MAG: sigma 54-interacting transcriptional regulator [Polyangiaceae bacterium]
MRPDLQPTDPLTWGPMADDGTEKMFSLLVVRDGETSTYPLGSAGKLLIGRAAQADVRIDHGSVSREHAALYLGESLRIEDLGSANGTRVRDVPLKPGSPIEIFPDDVIDLGAVLLVVQYRRIEQRLRRSCDPAFFELRVEEECARAAHTDEPFAVARLDVEGALGAHAIHLLLSSELRREDLIANSGAGKYEVLWPGVTPAEADQRCEMLLQRLAQRSLTASAKLVHCPRDGRSVADLLGRPADGASPSVEPARTTGLIVHDENMVRVCRLLARVADSELSVILLGETGVGKELCAELLHELSPRAGKRLLRLNCASLSETLLEAELFGHERGAFTGAFSDKPGLLETASSGTLFLDEVGDIPLATQIKLLRVLEAREVLRVGSRTPRPIDIRIVAAAHQDLNELITRGTFREDLFYRLNGISVIVPPLRERIDDIEPLARHFLARFAKPERPAPTLSAAAIDELEAHSWPGNVRELRNLMERALILCDGPSILLEHVQLDRPRTSLAPMPGRSRDAFEAGLRGEVKSLERERIERALAACHGNQRRAAEKLGLSRGALLRRLELLQIARPRKGS